jgi:hypothetical protein
LRLCTSVLACTHGSTMDIDEFDRAPHPKMALLPGHAGYDP